MAALGTRPPGTPSSAREAMGTALDTLLAAEAAHKAAVDRAAADRDAAVKQAAAAEKQRVQQATAAAAKQRDAVNRIVGEADRLSHQASSAVGAASIKLPATSQTVVVPASSAAPDRELAAGQLEMQSAFAGLGRALKELERVRQTLIVRALRKVGLPPM